MNILSFDIATKIGWAFGSELFGCEASGTFKHENYYKTYTKCRDLIELYKPDIVITAKPTRYYNAMKKLFMITGAMMVALDVTGVKLYQEVSKTGRKTKDFPNDAQMKKFIFGNGLVSKQYIMKHYKRGNEDEADACMFLDYAIRKLSCGVKKK